MIILLINILISLQILYAILLSVTGGLLILVFISILIWLLSLFSRWVYIPWF